MTRIRDLHAEWMRDENYRREFEELKKEFEPVLKADKAQHDAPRKDIKSSDD
jgi:hypothetical protein